MRCPSSSRAHPEFPLTLDLRRTMSTRTPDRRRAAERRSGAPRGLSRRSPAAYDEMLGRDGEPRPHWQELVRARSRTSGRDELARRWEQARRLIRENGVTYNVYGDPRGMDRPWELDPVPLLVSRRRVAAPRGRRSTQRAQLLEPRSSPTSTARSACCASGCCRPSWSSRTRGSSAPATAWCRPSAGYLHLYAADLARAPDGRWWVLADRTQAPSGAGYALENRIVLSRALARALPRLPRARGSRRSSATLRDTLARAGAPRTATTRASSC